MKGSKRRDKSAVLGWRLEKDLAFTQVLAVGVAKHGVFVQRIGRRRFRDRWHRIEAVGA